MTFITKLGIIGTSLAALLVFPCHTASSPTSQPAGTANESIALSADDPYIAEARVERALNHGPFEESDLRAMVRTIGKKKGLTDAQIRQIEVTIGGDGTRTSGECATGESNWDPKAVGDGGRSHGLVQIYGPAHPEVSIAEATDATFAVNFIVDEFVSGNEWKWTCWKHYYARALPHSPTAPGA